MVCFRKHSNREVRVTLLFSISLIQIKNNVKKLSDSIFCDGQAFFEQKKKKNLHPNSYSIKSYHVLIVDTSMTIQTSSTHTREDLITVAVWVVRLVLSHDMIRLVNNPVVFLVSCLKLLTIG